MALNKFGTVPAYVLDIPYIEALADLGDENSDTFKAMANFRIEKYRSHLKAIP